MGQSGDHAFAAGQGRHDRSEARNLLNLALEDARRLNLPEAQQIEQIITQAGLSGS